MSSPSSPPPLESVDKKMPTLIPFDKVPRTVVVYPTNCCFACGEKPLNLTKDRTRPSDPRTKAVPLKVTRNHPYYNYIVPPFRPPPPHPPLGSLPAPTRPPPTRPPHPPLQSLPRQPPSSSTPSSANSKKKGYYEQPATLVFGESDDLRLKVKKVSNFLFAHNKYINRKDKEIIVSILLELTIKAFSK
ncbi:uncharacterized protein LOC128388117 [Panonychus citri]|uniref:uncharacterized protein LOC128388117 n=1 Tax=Panonychus citri TaxID=50023 RepID=UPI00230736D0|nr:uncharacterized protein LOC128388117 [Panonychus citri]